MKIRRLYIKFRKCRKYHIIYSNEEKTKCGFSCNDSSNFKIGNSTEILDTMICKNCIKKENE